MLFRGRQAVRKIKNLNTLNKITIKYKTIYNFKKLKSLTNSLYIFYSFPIFAHKRYSFIVVSFIISKKGLSTFIVTFP